MKFSFHMWGSGVRSEGSEIFPAWRLARIEERTYWVSALIPEKPHICRSLSRALYNVSNKDSQTDIAGYIASEFHSVPFYGGTEIKSVSVWVWGVGGSRFVGVLLPAQDHFANRIAIELAPPTNKYIWGSNACCWKVLSDRISRGRGSDWFTITLFQHRFSHITLLLIALWRPLMDVWANICKSTSKQPHSYRLVTAHEITAISVGIKKTEPNKAKCPSCLFHRYFVEHKRPCKYSSSWQA